MKDEIMKDQDLDKLLFEYMPKANMVLDQLEEERDKDLEFHTFSKGYKKNIRKIIKEYSRTPFQKKLVKVRRYVAVILLLFILTNGVLIVAAEGYRERVFNAITNIYEKFTSIVTDPGESLDRDNMELNLIQPPYIPDGFELIEDKKTDVSRFIRYLDKDNNITIFRQSALMAGELRIDTEGTSIKEMKVNNQIIKYFLNKDIYTGYWNDGKYQYSITAATYLEEFMKIIEEIIKK